MNIRTLVSGAIGTIALLGAVACGSDSIATAPTASASFESTVNADVAPSIGAAAANDYTFYSSTDMTGSGALFSINAAGARLVDAGNGVSASLQAPPAAAAAWISPSCTLDPASGRFTCPPVSKNGQTWTTSYALFDANGVNQTKYDKVTTASINFIVSDTGAVSTTSNDNTFADTISRRHNETVSGLAGDPDTVHTWNGYGSSSVKIVGVGQITKVYVLASTDTSSNIRFRQPRDINPYPLSGTLVRNYTVTRTRLASDTTTHTASRRVVITFNGTANVPMTVGADRFVLNLDTRKVTKQ